MADANFVIPHFLGGEISSFAQGRFDKPDYHVSLNVCLNAFPREIGAWTRRPGTRNVGITRRGLPARVMKFDFEQANSVTLEFSDGQLRFRTGATFVTTNDTVLATAVSPTLPAVLEIAAPTAWATGDTLLFLGPATPLLENRQLQIGRVDSTHFSILDSVTGAAIDGAQLGPLIQGAALVGRIQELRTVYATRDAWSAIRVVQAKTTAILLSPAAAPQALTVSVPPPSVGNFPVFALAGAVFNDGPYLDAFTNGVQVTPNAKSGIVTLAISFPPYVSTKAYALGSFVTYASINYISLVDQNVNAQPDVNPGAWAATSANAALNEGRGILGSDVGRQVRLFSEPPAWDASTTYAASTASAPVVVSYNPTGQPGETLYYQAAVASGGKVPGTDTTNWTLIPQGAAIWTWGKIIGLSTIVDRGLAGSVAFGDMSSGGGLAAAFDGVFTQSAAACAASSTAGSSTGTVSLTSYVGKNYSGASDQKIQQVTIYPSSDGGFAMGSSLSIASVTFNLRGKASAPASSADGALLGSTGAIANSLSAVTVVSVDQVTAWKWVWVEQVTVADVVAGGGFPGPVSYDLTNAVAELSFFNPPGTGTGAGCNIEILGPPLLYTSPITIWRLGIYSDTTGWPTCGTYDDGRLWLGGVVKNRFDASMSNGVDGATVNFAPTNQYGAVAANNAISYTLNAKDANQIVWMAPEEAGIVMGTQAGEWLVRTPQTGAIGQINISARRVTKIGAANIEPYRTEHTNIFAQRFRRKLTEFFPDAYSGKFTGPNLADKAEHIVSAGIAEIAYTSAVTPVIWSRCDDGSLFGVTYKRDTLTTTQPPTFAGFHRHALGSGRAVESICAGPSAGGDLDALTMVTNDPASGTRHVELLTDTPVEAAPLAAAWYLDDAVSPTSIISSIEATPTAPYGSLTLNGLWPHNGKTVQVFVAGLDCGDRGPGTTGFTDFVVTNGSVTIPYGDGGAAGPGRGLLTLFFVTGVALSQIAVGFTYNSDGQLVRPIAPADSGARSGPALGLKSRVHQYAMLLSNSRGVEIGATFDKMFPVPLKRADGSDIGTLDMFSGVAQDTLQCDHSYDSMLCWRVSRPMPCNVVAISGKIQTQG